MILQWDCDKKELGTTTKVVEMTSLLMLHKIL